MRLGRHMSSIWERIKHRLKNYLVAGLLTVIPLATTIWLMVEVATRSIRFLTTIPKQINPIQGIHPFLGNLIEISVGLVAPILFLLLIGFMARNIVGQWLLNISERFLHAIPIAGSIYKTLKQLLTTVFADRGKQFSRVVLVEYPRKEAWSIGFVTGDFQAGLGHDTTQPEAWLSVFIPTTPNPTSGWYAIMREADTVPLQMPVEDAFKLLISGGIVRPDSFQTGIQAASNVPVNLRELAERERATERAVLNRQADNERIGLQLSETDTAKRLDIN
ncbi:MAG: DUF502 domain-containing protein [Synechococcus sp.]